MIEFIKSRSDQLTWYITKTTVLIIKAIAINPNEVTHAVIACDPSKKLIALIHHKIHTNEKKYPANGGSSYQKSVI